MAQHFPVSREDFTQSQLFVCLVLREHQKLSFRGTQALLEIRNPGGNGSVSLANEDQREGICVSLLLYLAWVLLEPLGKSSLFRLIREQGITPQVCLKCGYSLRALQGKTCPECGTVIPNNPVEPRQL
jgi:hypothetical protein